jgi:hypothetical protein
MCCGLPEDDLIFGDFEIVGAKDNSPGDKMKTASNNFADGNLKLDLSLPDWTVEALNRLPPVLPTLEARMAAVIEFARLNFRHNTGGPFAAGYLNKIRGNWSPLVSIVSWFPIVHQPMLRSWRYPSLNSD